MPEPASMLAEALRVLRTNGLLFIRDLVRPDSDEERTARLESELAPLRVVPSSEGLPRIAQLLREVVRSATGSVEKTTWIPTRTAWTRQPWAGAAGRSGDALNRAPWRPRCHASRRSGR